MATGHNDMRVVMRILKIMAVKEQYKKLSQKDKHNKVYPRDVRSDMLMFQFFIAVRTVEDYLGYDVAEKCKNFNDNQRKIFTDLTNKKAEYGI